MSTPSAIEDAIQQWFAQATGLPVLWGDQAVTRPNRPFAELRVIGPVRRLGMFDEQRTQYDPSAPSGQEMQIRTLGNREMMVSCQVYTTAVVSYDGPSATSGTDSTDNTIVWNWFAKLGMRVAGGPVTTGICICVQDNAWRCTTPGTTDRTFPAALGYAYPPSTVTEIGGVVWTLVPNWQPDTDYPTPGVYAASRGQVFTVGTPGHSYTGGLKAIEYVQRAQDALSTVSGSQMLADAGISIVGDSGVRDLSAVLDTAFEGRAQLDVTFGFARSAKDATTYIERVEGQGQFNGTDGPTAPFDTNNAS